jgi:hypothetical protein
VVSFDHVNGFDYLADPPAEWDRLRGVGPIVRSDQLGGYWIVTDRLRITPAQAL